MLDSEALSLYSAHREKLIGYANKIVRDNHRAEDIVQDAFLRFRLVMQAGTGENPIAYFYRIVRNLALDHRRRHQFENRLFVKEPEYPTLPEDTFNPANQAMAREELSRLDVALEELPKRTRVAFEMHRYGGYKLKEIAERLDISVSMTQLLVKRALKHCYRRMLD